MKTKVIAFVGIVLCLNISLSASMIIHNNACQKDKTIQTESGIYNEDYLYLGYGLQFTGVAQDLVFLGKELTFSGKTTLGLISLCKTLVYSGESGNGIIAAGMNVVVDGKINDNSYIACKNLNINEKAVVNGNLFTGCARFTMNGKLNGDLYAGAGEIIINNEITGNVDARGGRIIFGKNGKINGNLVYSSREKLNEKDLSKVTGAVKYEEPHKYDKGWNSFRKFEKPIGFLIGFGLFISYIFVGIILLFLPAFRKLDAKQSPKGFWNTSLWGLIPVLMYPAVVLICFIMVITIPFAFVLLLAAIPLFFVANIIGSTLLGKYLVTVLKWNVTKRHYQFLIGTLAAAILSLIPFINFLTFIFISALGWGVYISYLFNKNLTEHE